MKDDVPVDIYLAGDCYRNIRHRWGRQRVRNRKDWTQVGRDPCGLGSMGKDRRRQWAGDNVQSLLGIDCCCCCGWKDERLSGSLELM